MDLAQLQVVLQKECQVSPGERLLVGVSGGPDSMCLFDSLARLGFAVHAAHFDHHLRPESGREADVVRQAAQYLGAPFTAGGADVAAEARARRMSIEETARVLRYQFLFNAARSVGAQAVAVAHHADDQVETVLMHLLRGTGLAGLTGMDYRSRLPAFDPEMPVIRPLLGVWRSDILAYCRERSLPVVSDASNADPVYFRNRLRHELLPLLETYNPRVRLALWRMAQVLAGDEQLLALAEQEAWRSCQAEATLEGVSFDLERFLAQQEPMQRRLLRRAAGVLRPDLRDVDFDAIQRAVEFARAPARSRQIDFLQGLVWQVAADAGGARLLLVDRAQGVRPEQWPQVPPGELHLAIPGEVVLPGGWVLRAALSPRADPALPLPDARWEAFLDADRAGLVLHVRRPRPGDRFQPLGMDGHSLKLSDFWINQKLPRQARAGWPLVCSGELIAWLPGFRLGHPFRVTDESRHIVHLTLAQAAAAE